MDSSAILNAPNLPFIYSLWYLFCSSLKTRANLVNFLGNIWLLSQALLILILLDTEEDKKQTQAVWLIFHLRHKNNASFDVAIFYSTFS